MSDEQSPGSQTLPTDCNSALLAEDALKKWRLQLLRILEGAGVHEPTQEVLRPKQELLLSLFCCFIFIFLSQHPDTHAHMSAKAGSCGGSCDRQRRFHVAFSRTNTMK